MLKTFATKILTLCSFAAFAMLSTTQWTMSSAQAATPEIGKPAPHFTATDIHGKTYSLKDLKGKTVVLEWSNAQCPFVVKHYSTNNMQAAQKKATSNGVVWLTIVSSAEGKQGHMSAEQAIAYEKEVTAHSTGRILDESGEIGHLYGAKTTPHMFVIDGEGILRYAGAIDDTPSPNPATVEGAKNLVLAALDNIAAGEPVAVSQTVPYGCSVKY